MEKSLVGSGFFLVLLFGSKVLLTVSYSEMRMAHVDELRE